MEVCKVICLAVLFLIYYASCTNTSDLDKWREHEKRIRNFICEIPQPRSFRLADIISDKDFVPDIDIEIFPQMTILHRCDSQSGCCKSAIKSCAPQATEMVFLTFRIIKRISKLQADEPSTWFLEVEAANHTYCECQSSSADIR